MESSSGIGRPTATTVPGLFHLVEHRTFDEASCLTVQQTLPRLTRAALSNDRDTAERWRALMDAVRGYRRDQVLVHHEPAWVPLIDLRPPVHGTATFTHTASSTRQRNLGLMILGQGFGSATSVSFHDTVTFTAKDVGKSLRVRVLLSVTRYVNRRGQTLLRTDVEAPPTLERSVIDLGEDTRPDLNDVLRWRVVRRERLSATKDAGCLTWTYAVGSEARWSVQLGVPLPQVAGEQVAAAALEAAGAEESRVAFDLPYGRDYVFYVPAGEAPLVPRVVVDP